MASPKQKVLKRTKDVNSFQTFHSI